MWKGWTSFPGKIEIGEVIMTDKSWGYRKGAHGVPEIPLHHDPTRRTFLSSPRMLARFAVNGVVTRVDRMTGVDHGHASPEPSGRALRVPASVNRARQAAAEGTQPSKLSSLSA